MGIVLCLPRFQMRSYCWAISLLLGPLVLPRYVIIFCKLLEKMEREGYNQVISRADPEVKESTKSFPLTSGFLIRASHMLPKTADSWICRYLTKPIKDWLDIRLNNRYQSLEFK